MMNPECDMKKCGCGAFPCRQFELKRLDEKIKFDRERREKINRERKESGWQPSQEDLDYDIKIWRGL